MDLQEQIESPCIRQCTLDGDDVCVGCFRRLDEICAWTGVNNEAKKAILKRCEQRRKDAPKWHIESLPINR
ncbi:MULTISPECIES: DUF1289 domain-containing protein [unclassified Agarivorans]|uniref:DUF1289 domain-containing protein n=1 Tax=unclassified Agarivorans TaxID=2636026 RepID=UPI0026E34C19|nr:MULTISPECIES: DUF1289 domain-containing protein [unclassified Agarivorans]MDO6684315.1 DUF1289 domain-containing protein [Agarivorans sp. 3_MG-2023]MDO6714480.1 DUF1289 domain-containing protein [Agarivorans sp. 2_MG-2023]MDO6763131.1 DUF1289 domain-containing protein [Agarivorans sp. 1_MG-2023]